MSTPCEHATAHRGDVRTFYKLNNAIPQAAFSLRPSLPFPLSFHLITPELSIPAWQTQSCLGGGGVGRNSLRARRHLSQLTV